jgi:hypothetical protein
VTLTSLAIPADHDGATLRTISEAEAVAPLRMESGLLVDALGRVVVKRA